MRTIMVLNAKGGCGKSTLITNLAGYYASQGQRVALADFDVQASSMQWLAARPETAPLIQGLPAWGDTSLRTPKEADVLLMDTPAALYRKEVGDMVRRAQSVLMPVLPSPMDIRAAARFIGDLLTVGKVSRDEVKLAVVANRVREHTRVYHSLYKFLRTLEIPFVAVLRDSQNYIRAAERGLGVHELAPSTVEMDIKQWSPLLRWLNSKRSLPD